MCDDIRASDPRIYMYYCIHGLGIYVTTFVFLFFLPIFFVSRIYFVDRIPRAINCIFQMPQNVYASAYTRAYIMLYNNNIL